MSSIKGTNVLAPVVPFDTTDSHASHEARYGKGGFRSVADIAERDATPQLRREAGMLVLTMSDGKFWKLAADLAAWSEISLAGPQGPPGVAGVAGPQGVAGAAGAKGDRGEAGPQGIPGVAGAAGVAGPAGPAGADGLPGVAGQQGPAGPQGIPGVAGAKGDTGERGPAGPAGEAGAQGIQGIPGVAGAAGGAGAKGDRGDVGPAGPAGVAGAAGVAGQQGIQGPAGVAGATGPQGPAASLVYSSIGDFPATGSSTALYLDESSSRLYQWESPVYVEVGVSGGGAIHASTHATGGIDAITPASIGAAAASHVHSADAITSGTLADARLSSAVATYALLATSEHQSSSLIDVYPRGDCANLLNAPPSGTVWITFFTPTITTTVSSITMATGNTTAASGLTLARMGLYTFDETTATLVARCASDTSLFAATATSYQRSFSTVGSFPSSYQLVAGTRYGIAVLCVGTTMPNLAARAVGVGVSALSPRMSAPISNQTDLPTTATITSSQQTQPFARLS